MAVIRVSRKSERGCRADFRYFTFLFSNVGSAIFVDTADSQIDQELAGHLWLFGYLAMLGEGVCY
jgi:hypothetical protein